MSMSHIGNVQQYLLSRPGQLVNLEVRDDYARLIVDIFVESMFAYTCGSQTTVKGVSSMKLKY